MTQQETERYVPTHQKHAQAAKGMSQTTEGQALLAIYELLRERLPTPSYGPGGPR